MTARLPLLVVFLVAAAASGQPPTPTRSLATLTGRGWDDPKPAEPEKKGDEDKGKAEKDDNDKDQKKGQNEDEKDDTGLPRWLSAHGQATVVSQGNFPFHAPYTGRNSLRPNATIDSTSTATLFFASRVPWEGGELVFNPEVAGGSGLGGTTGLAGFPNGEATRAGRPEPTPYIARLFYRHVTNLGGEREEVADGMNQAARTRTHDRLTWQIGKMAAVDQIGDNPYSNDPRTQFLNWALMFNGAWDFPANVRGYTYGSTAELILGDWSFTYGVFGVPTVANGSDIDPRLLQANGHVLEIERAFKVNDRTGKFRFAPFFNRANMGNYREAIALDPAAPDVTATRTDRIKYGFFVNYDQELSDDMGLFARYGWNDGRSETWAYTEIDRNAALGLLVKGTGWGRTDDRVGVAVAMNGLSGPHRDYLAAGGVGFIVGDGRLNYGPESILEVFYNWRVRPGLFVTYDLQGVINPAYNRDRGPVGLAAVRLHYEF